MSDLFKFLKALDRGHDYYGPVPVTRWTAIYPCRSCGARFYTHRRCIARAALNPGEKPCCVPCGEYRRGERENVRHYGMTIHVCERKREGQWRFEDCPCGCAKRSPGDLAKDKMLHGTAFIGPAGERIDPDNVALNPGEKP